MQTADHNAAAVAPDHGQTHWWSLRLSTDPLSIVGCRRGGKNDPTSLDAFGTHSERAPSVFSAKSSVASLHVFLGIRTKGHSYPFTRLFTRLFALLFVRNGSFCHCHSDRLIGSRIRAFDLYQNHHLG